MESVFFSFHEVFTEIIYEIGVSMHVMPNYSSVDIRALYCNGRKLDFGAKGRWFKPHPHGLGINAHEVIPFQHDH